MNTTFAYRMKNSRFFYPFSRGQQLHLFKQSKVASVTEPVPTHHKQQFFRDSLKM